MENLKEFSKIVRHIYEKNNNELAIPFFSRFPENCCEGASFFFGHIAQEIFPNYTIEIIKGRRVRSGTTEYHYWIECQNQIFDLTADQFKSISAPIYGAKISHKHIGFKEVEREFISCFLPYYLENCIDAEVFFPIKKAIIKKIDIYKKNFESIASAE